MHGNGGLKLNELIVASRNLGKIAEIKTLMEDCPLKWKSLNDIEYVEIKEDQPTFVGNAIKKAETVSRLTGKAALADDSGLEVDALQGEPGVYSARYAGDNANDEENNAKLLERLAGVPEKSRSARFRCVIALAIPSKETQTVEGVCEGLITLNPYGSNGFGYDPVFFYPPFQATFAELSPGEKNRISHRGKAIRAVVPLIKRTLTDS